MQQALIQNAAIKKLIESYKTIWSLNHVSALAFWDMNTYMPLEGAKGRGEALGKIALLTQQAFLDKSFIDLLSAAKSQHSLNEYEQAVIRLLQRSLKFYQALPPDFIEEFVRVTSEAHFSWKAAKEQSNFSLFEPHLQKIVELTRKKASYLGYKEHPYDALLDEYEEELTTKEVEQYFSELKEPLIALLKKIRSSRNYKEEHALENLDYNVENMKRLTNQLLATLHYNMDHLRVDVAPHPFSTTIGVGDTRITTRYEGKDFARSYSSTIHEYGHALYDLQTHEDLYYTPISGGSSLIIHESQSRFWENFIGKSLEFIHALYPELVQMQPELKNYTPEQIHHYFNIVKPSLIRTEADEVTYHLHVLIRFEIEKALIDNKVEVKDLPALWNKKYKEYLGITPPNDSEGILQDVHWSQGSIGYFPTYSLGTALSAIWKSHLEKELGPISALVSSKAGLKQIQDWLKEHIHQYGSTHTFGDLLRKKSSEPFSSKYLLDYLTDKYTTIYSL